MSDKLKIMQERIVPSLSSSIVSLSSLHPALGATPRKPWSTAQTNGITRYIPNQGSSWHLQLTGAVDFANGRDVFDVDLYETSAADINKIHAHGAYAIAYFNGGAWQPGKPDSTLYPASVIGKIPMKGWPEERWLDIRQIEILRPIIRQKILLAKSKGFDAVDPDNMDGFTNDKEFGLTAQHQLAYNRMVAAEAHAMGLAVFLKNTNDLVDDLFLDFDGAVVEQAFYYKEAVTYQPFRDAGKPVFEVEYSAVSKASLAEAIARGFNVIKGKLALDGPTKQLTFY